MQNPHGIGGNAGSFGADVVAKATAEEPIQPGREDAAASTSAGPGRQENAPRDERLQEKKDDFFFF